jgi:glycerophosphoryl diester phosphodiesterase
MVRAESEQIVSRGCEGIDVDSDRLTLNPLIRDCRAEEMAQITWQSITQRDLHARPLVMGHRGSPEEAPENTLASFELALAQGAEILETDLRFTRDEEIVLIHDETVDRTTNGIGAVRGMTLADIKMLRTRGPLTERQHHAVQQGAGAEERASAGGEAPPTLEELLRLLRGEIPLALELKDDHFLSRLGAMRLVDLLSEYRALESTVLVSFSLPRLQAFRTIAPNLRIGMITLSNPFPLFPTEFLGPFFPLLFANPFYVRWARRLGKIVCPLDPSPEPRLGYYVRLGASVLLTNHPARTRRALKRWYDK